MLVGYTVNLPLSARHQNDMVEPMEPMSSSDWTYLRMLNKTDHQWGDPDKIDRAVILELDQFLWDYKLRAKVTCGTQGEHVDGSYHYADDTKLGCALDFMLVDFRPRSLPDIYLNLLRYKFGGTGVYSEWKLNRSGPRIGGFHVDTRETEVKALWVKGWDGYVTATITNFQKYFL